MSHHFILCKSTCKVYDELEAHMTKCNNSNALGNKYDIIPSSLIPSIKFLHSAQKFKECKEYFKKSQEFKDLGCGLHLKEVVFDGTINDLSAIYETHIETSIEADSKPDSFVFWILRVPMNTLVVSYIGGDKSTANKVVHKGCYSIYFQDIFIGATTSLLSACRLIEESTGGYVIIPENKCNKSIEIPTSIGIYKILVL